VKQIHHEELEDGDKERPSAFPKIMLKQTDSGIQQRYWGQSGHDADVTRCLLLTQSGHERLRIAAVRPLDGQQCTGQ
jgi:hypothetical protein